MVPHLPARLPAKAVFDWEVELASEGLSGLAATDRRVIVSCRDVTDTQDIYQCLDAVTGQEIWRHECFAPGELDYGQSPRATPLIHDGRVFLLGAFGDLSCVKLSDGQLVWARNIVRDFGAKMPTWGICGSPLVTDDKLIVQPGAPDASIVALDLATGETKWRSPGRPPSYSSFIVARLGGRNQLIGYDQNTLGGWDPATGKRIWRLRPPEDNDFNVSTPVVVRDRLFVATENNGARLYRFRRDGQIDPHPVGAIEELAPDMHTPVAIGSQVFAVHEGVFCLDATRKLQPCWRGQDDAFDQYASIIASPRRLLITTLDARLFLIAADPRRFRILGRLALSDQQVQVLSHPAFVGNQLYIRLERRLVRLTLGPQAAEPIRFEVPADCMLAEQGHCYVASMDFGEPGDKSTGNKSMLVLLEDGRPLGPPQSVHAAIRNKGNGRYSHWTRESLYFSTSDNSDPRSNGHKYEVASRNPKTSLGGLDRFPAARKEHVERITSNRHQYEINMGGRLDMENTRTLSSSNCYITFQNNLELTIENVGDVPVVNPRLVVNDRGNWYTFDSLLEEFTRGAKTEQEKVYLIWENMRQNLYHETPLFGNAEPHDPVKLFSIFGFNLCDDAGNAGCSLFHHAGFVGSKNRALRGHVQCEARINGALQFMDIDMDCFYLDRENETPVSGDRCARDHDLVRRELNYGPAVSRFTSSDAPAALFGPDDRLYDAKLRGHEIAYTLRPGEKAVYRWDNIGKYCSENQQRAHRPKYFGNSKFVYRPRLTLNDVRNDASAWKELRAVSTASGEPVLAGQSPDAYLVYRINTPYPVCGGKVRATCVGRAAGDRASIAISLDGKNWHTAWSKQGAGDHHAEVTLDQVLDVHNKPAKYRYFVRIGLASTGADPGPGLHALEIETDVLVAPASLPRLRLGTNHIRYWDATTGSHAVRITHQWKESNAVAPPPPVGMPKYPPAGAPIRDSIVTFRWPAVESADRYHLRVSRRADLVYPYRPCLDVIIPSTEWTVPYTGIFSPNTTYYWRLRCRDRWGVWGQWSDQWTFTWHGPRVPVDLRCEPREQTITLRWKPNPRGEQPVWYDVYGSDEKGFSIHKEKHSVPGRGTVVGNYVGRTDGTSMIVVSPELTAPAANKVFYRVVAIDVHGTESGCSAYAELPHPFVYSKPIPTARVNRPYAHAIQTLRSLGDYQCKPDPSAGGRQYAYRFWDIEQCRFKLNEGPEWLSIEAKSGQLSGTPRAGDVGAVPVRVGVVNQFGGRAEQTFHVTVGR